MLNLERGSRLTTLIVVLTGMIFTRCAFADDADAFVGTWRLVDGIAGCLNPGECHV